MGLQFVGIDIGTSTISGIIYDPETRDLRSVTRKNSSRLTSDNDWEDLQDPEIILSIVREILDDFLARYDHIKGIGITGQMHGILYVNGDGNSISPLFTWQDRRGDLLFKDSQSYASYLAHRTGYGSATGYGLVTHFYNFINNLIPGGSHRICTIMDYIVMKLANIRVPVIDPSNAASLGFFDMKASAFDSRALKKVSISQDILPEIVPSSQIAGYYRNELFVCNAMGDNQAGFLGSVRDIEKSVLINIGTSSQLSVYTDHYIKVEGLELRPFPGGGYILVGSALTGGSSLEILRNFYIETLKMFGNNQGEEIDFYETINSLQYSKEDLNQLRVDVLFRGTRMEPQKKGSIADISATNFTPANLALGFLQGISRELHGFFERIPENDKRHFQKLVGSGNAIRMNNILCRILEDTFGRKLDIPDNSEQAAFGACLGAMIAGKYVKSYSDLGQFISYV
jgi:sedoheptulokinase